MQAEDGVLATRVPEGPPQYLAAPYKHPLVWIVDLSSDGRVVIPVEGRDRPSSVPDCRALTHSLTGQICLGAGPKGVVRARRAVRGIDGLFSGCASQTTCLELRRRFFLGFRRIKGVTA
jgi:hypothetical protein